MTRQYYIAWSFFLVFEFVVVEKKMLIFSCIVFSLEQAAHVVILAP